MRFRSLDGLRGLAAVCVLVVHWYQTFPSPVVPLPSPLHAAFWRHPFALLLHALDHVMTLGETAVIVFFVLSGFVLAVSLEAPGESYSRFAVKRVLRIYPPFAFAILFASALFLLADPHPIAGLTVWFNQRSWTAPPGPLLLLGHLAMFGSSRFQNLDNAIWSLVHEMRISLVFPLIAFCVSRWLKASILLSLAASAIALEAAHHLAPLAADWAMSVHYTLLFFAGAALAQNRIAIRRWLAGLMPVTRMLLWPATFGCLLMQPDQANGWMLYVTAMGATGIVMLCFANARAVKVLEHPLPLYLGKISYSLYLVHLPVLLYFMHVFYGRAPTGLLIAVATALMFLTADLTNRLVERPFQKLGRQLVAARFARTA